METHLSWFLIIVNIQTPGVCLSLLGTRMESAEKSFEGDLCLSLSLKAPGCFMLSTHCVLLHAVPVSLIV